MEKRKLWFNDPEKSWVQVELFETDARHALDVDPENWRTEKPEEPVAEPVREEPVHEIEHHEVIQ